MSSPQWSSLLDLYQQSLRSGFLDYVQKQAGLRVKRGIYSLQVVLWLMIWQRLQSRGTLSSAVQGLIQGSAGPLLVSCRRVRLKRISCRTGAYSQARQKLPALLCKQVSQEIIQRLREMLNPAGSSGTANVFVLDGSSLELEQSASLAGKYPPASNQHGRSHWPVLRLLVIHDAETGLAQQPCWGAMYGPHAVSEQELAERAMDDLPAQSVILADRNFGVFSIAYAARQRNLSVVLRLTDVRARKLAGPISQPGDYAVTWSASRWDGGKRPRPWRADAALSGRLIVARLGRSKSQQWLYLFTTSERAAGEIVELYGRRWNIETDLRSLKRTVRLHHISAKSEEMMEKELFMAVSAYNLVRAVMCLAARRSHLDPRQLSFTNVLNVVEAAWPKLLGPPGSKRHQQAFLEVLDLAAQCTLPKRSKHRSFPRLQWRRGGPLQFWESEKTK